MQKFPFVIGICGGSCSGKTTLARELSSYLGIKRVLVIDQDSYYKPDYFKGDHSNLPNFDHPNAIDSKLLAKHLLDLKQKRDISKPVYDFSTHSRLGKINRKRTHKFVIVEGTLIFQYPELRKLIDLKIFLGTSQRKRLERRVKRDMEERGRSRKSVLKQFFETVEPMHRKFIARNKKHADLSFTEHHNHLSVAQFVRAWMRKQKLNFEN